MASPPRPVSPRSDCNVGFRFSLAQVGRCGIESWPWHVSQHIRLASISPKETRPDDPCPRRLVRDECSHAGPAARGAATRTTPGHHGAAAPVLSARLNALDLIIVAPELVAFPDILQRIDEIGGHAE